MVANTDTTTTNTPLLADNYFIPRFKMNLPQNLFHPIDFWTKDDVEKWIKYCIDEYSLGDINLNDFQMNGKALLLLSEDGFKKRSLRSGDILHKALQQHNTYIKSLNCQIFPYHLWNNFGLFSPSSIRHFNIPLPSPINYMYPPFNYTFNHPETKYQIDFNNPQESIRTRQLSDSSSSFVVKSCEKNHIDFPVSSIKQEYIDKQHETVLNPSLPIKNHSELFLKKPNEVINIDRNDNTRQIRYYNDRIDFHGDILMKPQGAKNCRILWEFLYILLEDPLYESIIHWENREKMIFRIIQADKLAALWGLQKNRLSMTYEKLSRGMRYYYSNNIISKEQSKRLLYRFMRSPDEIRQSMKRNGGTTNMIYSTINKKSSLLLPTTTNLHNQKSSSQIHNQFLQFISTYSPSYTSMLSNLNSTIFNTRNNSISKSDRSSSSSPESLDSSHDSDKQYCNPLQSFSSSTSTKRKQSIPVSLTNRLSHVYPLNLTVSKEEENLSNYKKQKIINTSSSI